jgi:hypothetical protein
MKDISQFANITGAASGLINALDAVGSSVDLIFADAIVAMEPTTVLEEAGIIVIKAVPDPVDKISFPIVRNTQLTWHTIDGRAAANAGSALGSDISASAMRSVVYKETRPTVKSAAIFLPDSVSLLDKVDFNLFAQLAAVDAKRKKEYDALVLLTTESEHTNIYRAYNFASAGSEGAGSTITPENIVSAKRLLSTGSDPSVPDFCLVHPIQYEDLISNADFAPGATSPGAMMRKAVWDNDGNLVRFNGVDIYVTELLPGVTGSVTTCYVTDGHPAIIGKKGWAIGRGEKQGITVSSVDDRIRHGTFKVIDMCYDQTLLVKESMVLLRCADA